MNASRALRMHLTDAASLGRLRQRSGIDVCVQEDVLWLRVRSITEDLDAALRRLPATRFTVLPDGQLVRFGEHVPSGYLPDDQWSELAQWMSIRTEPAVLAGDVGGKVALRFVRGGCADLANVILTTFETWQAYATNAPQVRLDRLAFALNGEGQVVIWGSPSPPIKGVRFVERLGVAVQAGWTWVPPVDRAVLAEVLSLAPRDLALLHGNGTWEQIHGDDFVRATRSAVRLSSEVCSHG